MRSTLEGLQSILDRSEEFEVVGQARDGVEAVRAASELLPNVIVMDVMMPGRTAWRRAGRSWNLCPRHGCSC